MGKTPVKHERILPSNTFLKSQHRCRSFSFLSLLAFVESLCTGVKVRWGFPRVYAPICPKRLIRFGPSPKNHRSQLFKRKKKKKEKKTKEVLLEPPTPDGSETESRRSDLIGLDSERSASGQDNPEGIEEMSSPVTALL